MVAFKPGKRSRAGTNGTRLGSWTGGPGSRVGIPFEGMVVGEHPSWSSVQQCARLGVSRSSIYYRPRAALRRGPVPDGRCRETGEQSPLKNKNGLNSLVLEAFWIYSSMSSSSSATLSSDGGEPSILNSSLLHWTISSRTSATRPCCAKLSKWLLKIGMLIISSTASM